MSYTESEWKAGDVAYTRVVCAGRAGVDGLVPIEDHASYVGYRRLIKPEALAVDLGKLSANVAAERDRLKAEVERLTKERDEAVTERAKAVVERDETCAERDALRAERDMLRAGRDALRAQLDKERDSPTHQHDALRDALQLAEQMIGRLVVGHLAAGGSVEVRRAR